MNKAALRKLYLEKRQSLSEGERQQFDLQIYHLFFQHVELSFVKVMHLFLPLEKNHEPDTWQILDRVRREFPGIRISLPKVNNRAGDLENFFFEGMHQLTTSNWGILEPAQGVPTPPEKIDLVLVPLLAFDLRGNRVGYGRGFYDKFLQHCRPECQKIGISFFEPVEKISDAEFYDIKLNACITPQHVYYF